MRCRIASLDQMGATVTSLTKYAETTVPMGEETRYYLRVVLNELLTNSFKYGGGKDHEVTAEVRVQSGRIVVTVDDGGRGFDTGIIGRCADIYSEGGRGLAIVKGLCQSLELNQAGNCVTASLAIQQ